MPLPLAQPGYLLSRCAASWMAEALTSSSLPPPLLVVPLPVSSCQLGLFLQHSHVSIRGGVNWTPAKMTTSKAFGIGGKPLVQPDGTVIVPINGFTRFNFTINAFVSKDGGATWGPTHRVAVVAFRHPAGGIRASIPLPSAEMDASGKVYVVWSDCDFEPGCP